jgi:hypothetical protein
MKRRRSRLLFSGNYRKSEAFPQIERHSRNTKQL